MNGTTLDRRVAMMLAILCALGAISIPFYWALTWQRPLNRAA